MPKFCDYLFNVLVCGCIGKTVFQECVSYRYAMMEDQMTEELTRHICQQHELCRAVTRDSEVNQADCKDDVLIVDSLWWSML